MDPHREQFRDLKGKLNREIELNSFISNEFLQTLLSGHIIRKAIQPSHWGTELETGRNAHKFDLVAAKAKLGRASRVIQQVRKRSSQIRDQARKLFAILILRDKCHLLSPLLDNGVDDSILRAQTGDHTIVQNRFGRQSPNYKLSKARYGTSNGNFLHCFQVDITSHSLGISSSRRFSNGHESV